MRTRAHRALRRNPSDSPRLVCELRITVTDSLGSSPLLRMKMDSANKIALKTARNLARSILLLSHVFTFPSHISSFDSAFTLPPALALSR